MKKEIAWKGLLPILCAALVFALLALRGSAQGRLQRTQRCFARNEEALQDIAQRFDAGMRSGFVTETLRGIHSVQEKLSVSSTQRVWNFLLEVLARSK